MDELRMEGGGVLLTVEQVSERIGKEGSWVRRLCAAGRFPGAVCPANRLWLIPETAIEVYLEYPDRRRKREEVE